MRIPRQKRRQSDPELHIGHGSALAAAERSALEFYTRQQRGSERPGRLGRGRIQRAQRQSRPRQVVANALGVSDHKSQHHTHAHLEQQ